MQRVRSATHWINIYSRTLSHGYIRLLTAIQHIREYPRSLENLDGTRWPHTANQMQSLVIATQDSSQQHPINHADLANQESESVAEPRRVHTAIPLIEYFPTSWGIIWSLTGWVILTGHKINKRLHTAIPDYTIVTSDFFLLLWSPDGKDNWKGLSWIHLGNKLSCSNGMLVFLSFEVLLSNVWNEIICIVF